MGIFLLRQGPHYVRVLSPSGSRVKLRLDEGVVVASKKDLDIIFPLKFVRLTEIPPFVSVLRLDNLILKQSPQREGTRVSLITNYDDCSRFSFPTIVVSFLWGDYGKQTWTDIFSQSKVSNDIYVNRLFNGVRANFKGKFEFKLFVDEKNITLLKMKNLRQLLNWRRFVSCRL